MQNRIFVSFALMLCAATGTCADTVKKMNAATLSEAEQCNGKWKSILIGDAKYSVSATERDSCWYVYLTNLIEIWSEELDRDKILQKCEKLNPNLSVEDIDAHQFVSQILNDIPKNVADISVEQIKLCSELEGGVFQFAIDLTKGSAQQLWEEVTMPLCVAAGELRRRQTILLDLVKRKDAEISEYKLNGAELTRKNIGTEPFCEDLFEINAPMYNFDSCLSTFQRIMEVQGNVKIERFSAKAEPGNKCCSDTLDSRETPIKIEAESNSEDNNVDTVIHNEAPLNIEDEPAPENVTRGSNALVPKLERNSPPKSPRLPKSSKSLTDRYDCKTDKPKRTQSETTSPAKRPRKNIHDFIK